jgi:hypothetical protein
MAALAGGAAIHPMERFDAVAADAAIRAEGITHLVGGDDMLLLLAETLCPVPRHHGRMAEFHLEPQMLAPKDLPWVVEAFVTPH